MNGNRNRAIVGIAALALLGGGLVPLPARPETHQPQRDAKIDSLSTQKTALRPLSGQLLIGYLGSWIEPNVTDARSTKLARLPAYVNVVDLAFLRPDASYSGSLDLHGTGLEFGYDGPTLKRAIALLRQRHPKTRILIAVGGEQYTNWGRFDARVVARFARDFDLDGVDLDYESGDPRCAADAQGQIHCRTDQELISVVHRTRHALPHPALLTLPGWSVGAYGEGRWKNAQPQSPWTGMMLALFRSREASGIDLVSVMAYEATNRYDPEQALEAYQHYFPGRVVMGIEAPPEGQGGHVYSLAAVRDLAAAVRRKKAAGLMLWYIGKEAPHPSPQSPSPQMIAQEVCREFHLGDCQEPLLP